jgi:solute carrier family 25 protein 39/40
MIGYEYLLARISPSFTGSNDPAANASSLSRTRTPGVTASLTPAPLVAGALARSISATVISPIEMFRIRLQALPGGKLYLPSVWVIADL